MSPALKTGSRTGDENERAASASIRGLAQSGLGANVIADTQVPVDTPIKNRRALAKIGDREITLRRPPQMVTSRSPCGARPVQLAHLYSMLVNTAVGAAPLRATAPASTGGARYVRLHPTCGTDRACSWTLRGGVSVRDRQGPGPCPCPWGAANSPGRTSAPTPTPTPTATGIPAISAPHAHPRAGHMQRRAPGGSADGSAPRWTALACVAMWCRTVRSLHFNRTVWGCGISIGKGSGARRGSDTPRCASRGGRAADTS